MSDKVISEIKIDWTQKEVWEKVELHWRWPAKPGSQQKLAWVVTADKWVWEYFKLFLILKECKHSKVSAVNTSIHCHVSNQNVQQKIFFIKQKHP